MSVIGTMVVLVIASCLSLFIAEFYIKKGYASSLEQSLSSAVADAQATSSSIPESSSEVGWIESLFPMVHSVWIVVLDAVYQNIAIRLTESENHRTELQFQDSLIAKLAIFQFVNNFVEIRDQRRTSHRQATPKFSSRTTALIRRTDGHSWHLSHFDDKPLQTQLFTETPQSQAGLYYIAFGKTFLEGRESCNFGDCGRELSVQLASIFIWRLLIAGNAEELLTPLLFSAPMKRRRKRQMQKNFLRSKLKQKKAKATAPSGEGMVLTPSRDELAGDHDFAGHAWMTT